MLYEGAIRFLQQADEAMEQDNAQTRYSKLTHAGEIVLALQAALDLAHGGDQARGLFDFYAGIDHRILSLHRRNDRTECAAVIDELRSMRDVWDELDRQARHAG